MPVLHLRRRPQHPDTNPHRPQVHSCSERNLIPAAAVTVHVSQRTWPSCRRQHISPLVTPKSLGLIWQAVAHCRVQQHPRFPISRGATIKLVWSVNEVQCPEKQRLAFISSLRIYLVHYPDWNLGWHHEQHLLQGNRIAQYCGWFWESCYWVCTLSKRVRVLVSSWIARLQLEQLGWGLFRLWRLEYLQRCALHPRMLKAKSVQCLLTTLYLLWTVSKLKALQAAVFLPECRALLSITLSSLLHVRCKSLNALSTLRSH